MFVARQLQKHEYMPWNEISRRYTTENIEFYTPEVWRGKSADKKQGSDGVVDVGDWGDANWACLTAYNDLLDMGVAPEQARMVLPQSMYTEWFWSGTVGAIAKMCNLRCKPDTQAETRIVADQISEKMKELFPVSWEALTNA
jgi:thymidylate synthase (FAD)